MASEESKRNRIMEYSFKKFTTFGIGHVTMDEIARGIGIGKGTLYKYFPSKEALLFSTIDYITSQVEKALEEIASNEKLTTIEKITALMKTVANRLSTINPAAFAYLERSLPEAYEKIIEIRRNIIMKNLLTLIEEGKRTGLFDPKLDEKLVAHILIGAADHIIKADVLATMDYSLDFLFKSIVSTILQGCLTEEGRKQALNTDAALRI